MAQSSATAMPDAFARQAFLAGARDTIPLVVGAIPFGLIFGTLSAGSGLSAGATLAMSAFVFAGSAQFIALGLLAAGSSVPIIILTTFVVNLRHLLYSASLLPYVRHLPQRWLAPMAFWLTDETFAVVIGRFSRRPASGHNRWYYLGSALAMYLNWQLCTFLGITVGQSIPNAAGWGLDVAMPVTFIGMIIPYLKNRPTWLSVVVAGLVSVMAYPLPHKVGLILAAMMGIAAGLLAESRWGDGERRAA